VKKSDFTETINWYDRHAEEYATITYPEAPHVLIDQFLGLLPKQPVILDAGCGPGRDSGIMQTKGAAVTGIDISEGLLKIAKERNPAVTFVYGNFLNLPFKDKKFDGIWAQASLVHLEKISDVRQTLFEFHRTLQEKGVLHVRVRKQMNSKKTAVVSDKIPSHVRFFRYFSENEMKRYLETTGFTIRALIIQNDHIEKTDVNWFSIFAQK
jgi:ubiquinone/menaquinone biosynthesis C-methylase UbiE